MSEEVYEGTPLEGYLNETRTAEDWGIESNDGHDSELEDFARQTEVEQLDGPSSISFPASPLSNQQATVRKGGGNSTASTTTSTTYQYSSAPGDDERIRSERRFSGPNRRQIPLVLGQGRLYTEEERFRQSLRSLLGQKVSFEETSRFLDQFRYIIISSSLLESQPLFNTWSLPQDSRRRKLLFDQKMPWIHLYVEPAFAATGSSGIVCLCVYLHYRFKKSASKGERVAVAIILTLAIILYHFATSRRRLLRNLRRRALVFMELFTQSAKKFDGDCVRMLRDLQDLDIVANGFAPQSRPNFLMANLAKQKVAGRKMRSVLASALHLLKEAYLDAFKDCVSMGDKEVIKQFFNIYDLQSHMVELNFTMSNEFIGFAEPVVMPSTGPESCFVSITELKRELRKVHLLRRGLLCCLLAAPSTGKSDPIELEAWTTICDHLLNANNLCEQLSNLIVSERLSPAKPENASSLDQQQQQQQRNAASPSIVEALARARHLSARLDIINEVSASSEDAQEHIRAIGSEIAELGSKWNKFMELYNLGNDNANPPFRKHCAAHARQSSHFTQSAVSSPTLVMTPEMPDFSSFSIPELADTNTTASEDPAVDAYQPTQHSSALYEGEAPIAFIPRSNLSREERIKIAKRERDSKESTATTMSRRSSLAIELSSVLSRRN